MPANPNRPVNDSIRSALDERNRFLVELDDAVRPLERPEDITQRAARLLGMHLKVNRCAYADVEADEDTFNLTGDFNAGVASIVGRYTFTQFGAECLRLMRAGEPYIVTDSELDPRAQDVRESYRLTRIRAVICVSLKKSGRFVGAMAVHQITPRAWTAEEIELVQLVASRCWESIERARVTRELRDSEYRLRLAQRAARLGSFDWDVQSGRMHWSAELELLYGLEAGSFEGTFDDWLRRCVPEDAARIIEEIRQLMERRQEAYDYEFRAILASGGQRWFRGRAQFEYDADGKPLRMSGVNMDIDEQKRAAQAFAEAVARSEAERESLLAAERIARSTAERASALKDEFLATLSHELRTPLNAILGWTHVLQGGKVDPTRTREGLEVIARNARAQAQIVEDLLDMNRIMAGRLRLEVRRIDLTTVLHEALDSVRPAAEAKGIRLQAILDPQAGPVSGDPGRLQQVFWNLLANAIKFTPRNGRVQMTLERVSSHLEVSVADSGEGVPPAFLPHVFDRFRQADASTTRRHGGLGLGLAISKQLVELHGGSIRARSAGINAGATFTVALPLAAINAEPETTVESRTHPRAPQQPVKLDESITLHGVRVMMVDDEPDARNLVRRLLEDHGAHVVTASSGEEAFSQLAGSQFDVLISDIGMPHEDGYAFLRRVRALGPDAGGGIPALALTAYARAEDRVRAILAGFQMHIAKPVEAVELITMVASLAGRTNRAAPSRAL
jgi:signal transduction histidine kinase/ActR/RegA family two-component response regulator